MFTSLHLTYADVAANPELARVDPFSKRRDLCGLRTLWEGHQKKDDRKSPLFRVSDDREGRLRFFRFDKRYSQWEEIEEFEIPQFFARRRDEDIPEGVVRIELFSNGRVTRTKG